MPLSINLREEARKEHRRLHGTLFREPYGTFKDWAIGLFVILAVVGVCLAIGIPGTFVGGCGGARGEYVGYVTAVEDRQNVTWDSTVVHFKTDTESTQEDAYCVRDSLVRDALRTYAEKRALVVIRYANDLVMWRWECNGGDSIIVGVREAQVKEAVLP